MADKVKGGRERINGLTMSAPEKRLVDRARSLGKRRSRAEYIRDAAIEQARRDVDQARRDVPDAQRLAG